MGKLTKAQQSAMYALPCEIVTWRGKVFSGMPKGIKTRLTLHSLRKIGLAKVRYSGTRELWDLTDTGRAALREGSHDS